MNLENILQTLNITYSTRDNGTRTAYVVECPYCIKGKHKDPSGAFFAEPKLTYTCWRGCGYGISSYEVLSELSGAPLKDVIDIVAEYGEGVSKTPFKLNSIDILPQLNTTPIDDTYNKYFESRGINYASIQDKVLLTPHPTYYYNVGLESVSSIRMDNRIVFPVYDSHNKLITFTGRTIESQNPLRYVFPKGCTYNMKDYGWSFDKSNDVAVIVEGPFDALKFGTHAHCCCGINFTIGFTNTIICRYKKAIVLFDPEPKAQQQARSMRSILDMFLDVAYVKYPYQHDIGDCSKDEIKTLRNLCGLDENVNHLL